MNIAKITSKGQVTIPKEVRNALNLKTGGKIVFIEKDGGYMMFNSDEFKLFEKKEQKDLLNGIIASMAMESLETKQDMLDYAEQRLNGTVSYLSHIKEIEARYKKRIT